MSIPRVRYTMRRLLAIVAVIAVVFAVGRGPRLHPPAGPTTGRGGNLPGSRLTIDEATKQADLVVVASIFNLGGGFSDEVVSLRKGLAVKASAELKGSWDRPYPENVAIMFRNTELEPKKGQEYIMFARRTASTSAVKRASRGLQIIKLLDKTTENLEAVDHWSR